MSQDWAVDRIPHTGMSTAKHDNYILHAYIHDEFIRSTLLYDIIAFWICFTFAVLQGGGIENLAPGS